MKKFIALLSAFLVCTSICGCEAKNADSTVETTETTTITETNTLEINTTINSTTASNIITTEIVEMPQFEKNATIVNVLTNGFTYDTQDDPIITFDAETNTYIVVAPTQINASEFDTYYDNNEWDSFVNSFASLSESILNVAYISDETANIKVIFALNKIIPAIIYENNDVTFDLYNSEASDKVCSLLETFVYANSMGYATTSYDKDTNSYYLALKQGTTKDFFTNEKWDSLSYSIADICKTLKQNCLIMDNTVKDLTVEYIDVSDNTAMLTVVNGEITYNYSE